MRRLSESDKLKVRKLGVLQCVAGCLLLLLILLDLHDEKNWTVLLPVSAVLFVGGFLSIGVTYRK